MEATATQEAPAAAVEKGQVISVEEIQQMSRNELRAACKDHQLGTEGRKAELAARLTRRMTGTTSRHTPGNTLCKYCGAPVFVKNTRKGQLADGRLLITRSMQCTGKGRHRYPLKEVVKPR